MKINSTGASAGRKHVLLAMSALITMATVAAVQNLMLGPNYFWSNLHPYTHYNNFIIFRQSFAHLISGENLYTPHLAEYADLYKYSPTFALLMAPFAAMPLWAGLITWNLLGALLLFAGLRSLIADARTLLLAVAVLAPEFYTSASNSQSNAHIAGMLLLGFSHLESGRAGTSTLLLALTVYIKLFTLALLPLLLLYRWRWRAVTWGLAWMAVLLALPAMVTGVNGLVAQYQNWLVMLAGDRSASAGIGVLGLAQALSGATLNKDLVLLAGGVMLLAPLARAGRYGQTIFRTDYFCLALLWMVLFNHKAESPTFIIAMAAVTLYAVAGPLRGIALFFLCGSVLFTSLAVTDIVPLALRKSVVEPYCLKALFPTLLMCHLFVRTTLGPTQAAAAGSGAE